MDLKPQLINFNWTSVVMLLMLLILIYILYKLLYKPFFEITDQRRKKVESDLMEADRARREAEELKKQMEEELRKARAVADEIVSRAEREADEIITKAKERAKVEASRIIESARAQVEIEREEAMREIERRAGELAVSMALKILKGVLDEKAKREYLKRIVEKELRE